MVNLKYIESIAREYLKQFPESETRNFKLEFSEKQILIEMDGNLNSVRLLNHISNIIFKHINNYYNDQFFTLDMCLVIEESVLNIYNHSYPEHKGKVDIQICLDEREVTIRITDYGEKGSELDLQRIMENQPTNIFDNKGRGFMIIRKIVDQIKYVSNHGKNTLELIKKMGK